MVNRLLTRKGKIYCLCSPDGTPFYVGCTIHHMAQRLCQHLGESKRGKGLKAQAVRQYGFDITAKILEIKIVKGYTGREMSKQLRPLEEKWINKLFLEGHPIVNCMMNKKQPQNAMPEEVGGVFKNESLAEKLKRILRVA